jgi:hypothetical protein
MNLKNGILVTPFGRLYPRYFIEESLFGFYNLSACAQAPSLTCPQPALYLPSTCPLCPQKSVQTVLPDQALYVPPKLSSERNFAQNQIWASVNAPQTFESQHSILYPVMLNQ